MTEMVERVARAICEADSEPWDELGETGADNAPFPYSKEMYRKLARAAIAAMREPTEGMNAAGALPWRWTTHEAPPGLELPFGWTNADTWRVMIDAALAQP